MQKSSTIRSPSGVDLVKLSLLKCTFYLAWNNISGCATGNIPMDTADPWTDSAPSNKSQDATGCSIKEETTNSWADFSNFPPSEFGPVADSPPNICVTLPSAMPPSNDLPGSGLSEIDCFGGLMIRNFRSKLTENES